MNKLIKLKKTEHDTLVAAISSDDLELAKRYWKTIADRYKLRKMGFDVEGGFITELGKPTATS